MIAFRSNNEADRHVPDWVGPLKESESKPRTIVYKGLDEVFDYMNNAQTRRTPVRGIDNFSNVSTLIRHIVDGAAPEKKRSANYAGILRASKHARRAEQEAQKDLNSLVPIVESEMSMGAIRLRYESKDSDLRQALQRTILSASDRTRPPEMTNIQREIWDTRLSEELDDLVVSTDVEDHKKTRSLIQFAVENASERRANWAHQLERVHRRMIGAGMVDVAE